MVSYKIGFPEFRRRVYDDQYRIDVYFPHNCRYCCPFCTSKRLYSQYPVNPEKVLQLMEAVGKSKISVVAITGGEPFGNPDLLGQVLDLLPDKIVFINSTMMAESVEAAHNILTTYKCVKGVSVSRHEVSWERDVMAFYGKEYRKTSPQAHDRDLLELPVGSLRINAVVDGTTTAEHVKGVIDRWDKWAERNGLSLSLRENYNGISQEQLHVTDNPMLRILTSPDLGLTYVLQSDCHVSDNQLFVTDNGLEVRYHRGLANTRVQFGNIVEIESLVSFPDGHVATDWDRTTDGLEFYCGQCGLELPKEAVNE